VGAIGEERTQPFGYLRNRIWMRDADDVETLDAGGLGERGFQIGPAQKSRSA
jgi:hypothetical protein